MFILGGIILEISNHRYSSCYHLRATVEITRQASMLHEVLSLVYLFIALFRLDIFTLFRGLYGRRDILRAGYIVFFFFERETHRSRPRFWLSLFRAIVDLLFVSPLFLIPIQSYSYHVSYKYLSFRMPMMNLVQPVWSLNMNYLCCPYVFCEQRGLAVKDAASKCRRVRLCRFCGQNLGEDMNG